MLSLKKTFLKCVDNLREELVELTREMVRIPSENPPGDERAISELVMERLGALGFMVELVEAKPNRVNTLGSLGGLGGGKNLLFNGHYDTVPKGNPEFWTMDPFKGTYKDGLIYGRGAGDMKGGIASAIIAAKALCETGISLRGNFQIHAVADEEYFGRYGTRYLCEKGYVSPQNVDMAVVGEGSVYDGVIGARTAVRGRQIIEIVVKGKSAHSSRPQDGVNAVLKMGKVLSAINDHEFKFHPHPLLPAPTIAPGTMIKGGTKDNVIPELCEAICDVRVVPGMTIEGVLSEIREIMALLKEKDPELNVDVSSPLAKPPSEISTNEELFRVAKKAVMEVVGYELEPMGTAGSNDTSWLTTIAGVPAMALGPGGGNAHGPDEWVSVDCLVDFSKIYGLMAMDICNVS
jgi:acetylornithine deacetylase/succinyl-diaminopimelate desuccinylase family protein